MVFECSLVISTTRLCLGIFRIHPNWLSGSLRIKPHSSHVSYNRFLDVPDGIASPNLIGRGVSCASRGVTGACDHKNWRTANCFPHSTSSEEL